MYMEEALGTLNRERSPWLDILKAVAIIAVIFYHLGYFQYGYLGVDIFLVINGYLVVRSINESIKKDSFFYANFFVRRILRLMPIVLIAVAVCMLIGFFTMLPDDYENLAESAVATIFLANNMLASITTRNYWNVVNEFKPLMHTWYLGILMQGYFVLSLIPVLTKKLKSRRFLMSGVIYLILALGSLLLYLNPSMPEEYKFYWLPFRFFELSFGAALACFVDGKKCMTRKAPQVLKFVADIGKGTLSIYIWHQIILAFIRYTIKTDFSLWDVLGYLLLVAMVSGISYFVIERPLAASRQNKKKVKVIFICTCVAGVVLSGLSLMIYARAGVVRDVPELNISKDQIHRHMHAEYVDKGYDFDRDFLDDGKTKVLVIGSSFGRDWINILLESPIGEELDVSYIFPYSDEYIAERENRMKDADDIFYVLSDNEFNGFPESVGKYYDIGKVYIVGNKNFGVCNGIIYNHRNDPDYLLQSITLPQNYLEQNERLLAEYTDHYIDMIGFVQNDDGTIRVFTPEGKFISQDCLHLTQAGAQYYASVIELSWVVR